MRSVERRSATLTVCHRPSASPLRSITALSRRSPSRRRQSAALLRWRGQSGGGQPASAALHRASPRFAALHRASPRFAAGHRASQPDTHSHCWSPSLRCLSAASPLPLRCLSAASPPPLLRQSVASLSPVSCSYCCSLPPMRSVGRMSVASSPPLRRLSAASPQPLRRLFAAGRPLSAVGPATLRSRSGHSPQSVRPLSAVGREEVRSVGRMSATLAACQPPHAACQPPLAAGQPPHAVSPASLAGQRSRSSVCRGQSSGLARFEAAFGGSRGGHLPSQSVGCSPPTLCSRSAAGPATLRRQ